MTSPIDLHTLAQLLDTAHKDTYANKNAPKAPSTRLGSEDYQFQQGDFLYHDTYFGETDFIGNEIIYENDRPIWGMNYYGYLLDPSANEEEVYGFLRKALVQSFADVIPVRGPALFQEGSWIYENRADGQLDRFSGTEVISKKGEQVYRCEYQGGFIG